RLAFKREERNSRGGERRSRLHEISALERKNSSHGTRLMTRQRFGRRASMTFGRTAWRRLPSADSPANDVTPVDPDALPVAMRPMAGHPDVARAVMNVIWAVRVIRSIVDRNDVTHVCWRRTGRPVINR